MPRYTLIAAFTIAMMCIGLIANEQADAGGDAPAKYSVSVSFTVPNPAGKPIVVELPDEVVKWNETKTIEFEVGSETYHVTAVVKRNAKQDKVAKITARIDIDGELLAFPSLEMVIGAEAWIETKGYGINCKAVELK